MRSNRERIVIKPKTLPNRSMTLGETSVKISPRRTEKIKNDNENASTSSGASSNRTKRNVLSNPPNVKVTEVSKQNVNISKLSTRSNFSKTTMPQPKPTATVNKRETTNVIRTKRPSVTGKTSTNSGPIKSQYFPNRMQTSVANASSVLKSSPAQATTVKKLVQQLATNLETSQSKDRDRTKTRTLSPSEIKFAKKLQEPDKEEERPRTATLRTHVGKEEVENLPKIVNDEPDYEDDFESYESDFEEYHSSDSSTHVLDINTDEATSSSESSSPVEMTTHSLEKRLSSAEERKMDSGNFDMPESKRTQMLHQINEAAETGNRFGPTEHSNLTSLSDEGFDEGVKQTGCLNLRVISFVDTKKEMETKNIRMQRKKRGEEILSMIRLDSYSFSLFEVEPVPYDAFMQFYAGKNCEQVSSQTGDENADANIQTDEIICTEKWAQFPPRLAKDIANLEHYKEELLGTGCKLKDNTGGECAIEAVSKVDYSRLNRFLNYIEPILTTVIKRNNPANVDKLTESKNIPFSKGFVELGVKDKAFLINRPVTNVVFSKNYSWLVLTSHTSNTAAYMDENEKLFSRPLICLWNILDVSTPEKILVASSDISACDIINGNANLVFAGLHDGTVLIWDLDENTQHHREVFDKNLDKNFLLRSPTYSTATNSNGHETAVVSLQLIKDSIDSLDTNNLHLNTLVSTLDENGKIIIWTAIIRENASEVLIRDQGLAHWGKVILAQHTVLSVWEIYPDLRNVHFTVMEINKIDPNHFYIGTNTDSVVHFHRSGRKYHPKIYTSKLDKDIQMSQIACCPFSEQYFLVSCDDGTIRLHSRNVAKPLMTLINTAVGDAFKIELLQWSTTKACVFYTFDSSNTLHVWDLASSDMFPMYSIPLRDKITTFKVSPINKSVNECYMAIAMENGSIYLHVLNEEYGIQPNTKVDQEKATFINYVHRL